MQITPAQNALIQVYSRQLCETVKIVVNGELVHLSHDDFRRYAAACFRKEASRMALSPEGDAVVMLPASTRSMSREEASEFLSWLEWYASFKGIRLIEPELEGRT